MSPPLGPLIAEIFLSMIELGPLKNTICNMHTYCRYVDDIYCIVDKDKDLELLLNDFNNAHEAISFTIEKISK